MWILYLYIYVLYSFKRILYEDMLYEGMVNLHGIKKNEFKNDLEMSRTHIYGLYTPYPYVLCF